MSYMNSFFFLLTNGKEQQQLSQPMFYSYNANILRSIAGKTINGIDFLNN